MEDAVRQPDSTVSKDQESHLEEYADELAQGDLKQLIARLKERKYSNLVFSPRHLFTIKLN